MQFFVRRKVRRNSRFVCCVLISILLIAGSLTSGCTERGAAQEDTKSNMPSSKNQKLRDAVPQVLVTEAPGTVTYESSVAAVDVSNASAGYVMLNYTGTNEKVKFQIRTPDQIEYTYLVTGQDKYEAYPLSGGDGSYQLTVLESTPVGEDMYAVVFTQNIETVISDTFTPFLYPNHYVDFTASSKAVTAGEELAENCTCALDVISNIYHYIIQNIEYDTEKAQNVSYGYTPDIDETLESGRGICFDYAALITAMLRSQRIPTKLEVGYAGEVYHAWISCYIEEKGWIDDIIEFDGENWTLMDPTLAAGNDQKSVKEYIGDGSKYIVKYTY